MWEPAGANPRYVEMAAQIAALNQRIIAVVAQLKELNDAWVEHLKERGDMSR